jgi:hypothetical protein
LSFENRRVVRSDICPRPAHHAFDFASNDSDIAEHAVIHVGELSNSVASSQFGFDRSLHLGRECKDSCNEEPNGQT